MTPSGASSFARAKPDYGVDAPSVMRNLFLGGGACLLVAFLLPADARLGPVVFNPSMFLGSAIGPLAAGAWFLLYIKVGKFRHRDMMLGLIHWRGDEQVLDVGCGRGLLLAGAARHLTTGHATGIDVWSNKDMGGNSAAATMRNLEIEDITSRCTIVGIPAQEMSFSDASFDVVVSNLCLHNIEDVTTRRRALEQIARVLRPGGTALISDYKLTGEYASVLQASGLVVEKRHGSFVTTFPHLTVVIARKPALGSGT